MYLRGARSAPTSDARAQPPENSSGAQRAGEFGARGLHRTAARRPRGPTAQGPQGAASVPNPSPHERVRRRAQRGGELVQPRAPRPPRVRRCSGSPWSRACGPAPRRSAPATRDRTAHAREHRTRQRRARKAARINANAFPRRIGTPRTLLRLQLVRVLEPRRAVSGRRAAQPRRRQHRYQRRSGGPHPLAHVRPAHCLRTPSALAGPRRPGAHPSGLGRCVLAPARASSLRRRTPSSHRTCPVRRSDPPCTSPTLTHAHPRPLARKSERLRSRASVHCPGRPTTPSSSGATIRSLSRARAARRGRVLPRIPANADCGVG